MLTGVISRQIGAWNAIFVQGVIALIIVAIFSKYPRKDYLDKKNLERFKERENEIMGKFKSIMYL